MNTFNKIYTAIVLLLAVLLLTLAGCDKGNDPTAEEAALKKLKSKTWQLKSVTVDGVDRSQDYAGMSIIFSDHAITAVKGGVVWRSQDTWQFTNAQATAFIRGDGVTAELITLTSASLVVRLSWNETTYGPGRVRSVAGEYIFSFE